MKQTLALASLALVASAASAGISATKHNLTTTGTGPNKQSSTEQICVFCHTPHAANTGVEAPLWNKGLPAATGYTTYSTANSSTIDGEVLGVGSVSAACLSCHDGTQAMDNLVNAPGSGGYTSGGANQAYVWTAGGEIIGASGNAIANLGQNLRNDHPIGIQYCGGGITGTGTTVNGSCRDSDFAGAATRLKTKTINSAQVFWIDTSTVDNTRSKSDIILYTRDFSGGSVKGPSVECASCHDPHVETKGSDNISFMRVTTAGSQICLACHTK
ncbi:cytochrome c3 family protein [Aromatoleum toluclasticum]|uniref:cytochrome c3 family protein n=1 Tax=Aromatoleum toluclasticum TaxID=92003 RepID=UPI00037693D2|nr:cytochrome c3 family protein [Aromatoleum toluclasticum]MCC4114278.1 cytochrome c3 family protein [Aromatoleum toluclasticum]